VLHVPVDRAAGVACGNPARDVLALRRKGKVRVYRVQSRTTLPNMRKGGNVDSVNVYRTVECKCHRAIALKDFVAHILGCPAIPRERRELLAMAFRVLLRNPQESLRTLERKLARGFFKRGSTDA
jgi:DNA-binding transcriptional regulator WhiA